MLTQQQLAARAEGIGASECAAVLGLDPYCNASDLWMLKTGRVEALGDQSDKAEIGNVLEPVALRLAGKALGKPVLRPTGTYKSANGVMLANLDGQVEKAARGYPIVEAKSTGIVDGWGEAGTDQVPERVLIQVMAQMHCSGAAVAHVARLLGRFGFSFALYTVRRNDPLCRLIEDRVCEFWRVNVDGDVPPGDAPPSVEVLKRVRREAGKTVEVPADVFLLCKEAREATRAAIQTSEQADAALMAALGDAEAGECELGRVTYLEVHRREYVAAATTYRQLRFPNGKGGLIHE